MREIVDARGQRWRVWETTPSRAEGLGGFGGGWLTFDDGTERRRLAPVPENWERLSDVRLALLLRAARPSGAITEYRGPDRRRDERREGERRLHDRRRSR